MWGNAMAAYDYLVVGGGMFGAVFARCAAERGKRVLIVDKRHHLAGNCYTEAVAGIQVHRYGPHIFHTDDERIWRFVNRFARFNNYIHHALVHFRGRTFSFPINMMTLVQLWGINTPAEAEQKLREVRVPIESPRNLRDWILSQVGEEIYEVFVRGYTTKQWGHDPAELPASIIRRLPIRQTFDDRYFGDTFQGIPIGGYTRLFENMLDHENIEIQLGVDYFEHASELRRTAGKAVYTGKVDEFFDYRFGELEYRSLRFETELLEGDFQGTAVVNYTDEAVPFTRITEHKHFEFRQNRQTVITREYPQAYDRGQIPYYPICDAGNTALYERYRALAERSGVLFGGRLATYRYFDMHQVVGQALATARKEFGERPEITSGDVIPLRAAA
jgi:UDP-galactopyranose mutase